MTTKPIIFRKGKRISIGPIKKEDMPIITEYINDSEVTQFLTIDKPQSLESELEWFENLSKRKHDVVFAIRLLDESTIIGVMGLHNIDHKNGLATTGSFIGKKDLWNKGYGTEAKMLVLEYAFNTLNLRKVCSDVYDFNGRSRRCLEKCGYVLEEQERLTTSETAISLTCI